MQTKIKLGYNDRNNLKYEINRYKTLTVAKDFLQEFLSYLVVDDGFLFKY